MKSTVAETSQDWTNHRVEYYGSFTIHYSIIDLDIMVDSLYTTKLRKSNHWMFRV